MYDLLVNAPFVERATALQWNYTGEAFAVLHYVEGEMAAFDAAVADVDPVVEYELVAAGEGAFYAYVHDETTAPFRALFDPISSGGLVVVPPVVYRTDGQVEMSAFGPSDLLQSAVDAARSPIELTLEQVGGLTAAAPTAEARLSERQRAALEAGLELGYYDVPRSASQADVAAALDCAPSTVAEHLRKGEATLLRSVLRSR